MLNQTRPWSRAFRAAMAASALAMAVPLPPILTAQKPGVLPSDTAKAKREQPLFTLRDAVIAAGFAATTVAFFPLDKQAARELQNPNTQANRLFKNSATGVELIASPGAYVIGGALYAVGRFGHYERVMDLGWHGTEAVLVGETLTNILKGTLGRARPFVSADTNPSDFAFAGGFGNGNRSSFPSGHATTAFAAAAAVTAETARWWPQSTWIVGPMMYGGATLVGLSRMYHNRHWGSDVALGAAIGTFSGRKVVQYAHRHPHNLFDRAMLRTTFAPTADHGGMMIVSIPLSPGR